MILSNIQEKSKKILTLILKSNGCRGPKFDEFEKIFIDLYAKQIKKTKTFDISWLLLNDKNVVVYARTFRVPIKLLTTKNLEKQFWRWKEYYHK